MSATMNDVARLAGVSIKTVSNVVNDYPYIRETTKQRVLAAIAELGYQVNPTARSLRSGRTGMIGLALPELSLSYFAELADLVMRAAVEHGLTVLIEQTEGERDREIAMLSGSRRRMTDGLVFSPLGMEQPDVDLLRVDYPLVLLGERIFDGPADHVTMQNVAGARLATEHLIARGCRRIAAIGEHPGEQLGSATLRLDGYREALAAAGLPYDPALVGPAGLWHRQDGATAMGELLDAGVRPDGVVAFNDTLAFGAIYALQQRGLRVPEDLLVVGFDDTDEAGFSLPPLTSINPSRDEIARRAVELLVARIASGPDAGPPVTHHAGIRLVERASSRRP
ncbi:MAG TPA: LacI family DNA-binding transcriptional regulator [Cellulomonas sp.]